MRQVLIFLLMMLANLVLGQIIPPIRIKYLPMQTAEIPTGVYRFQSALGEKSMDVMWGNNANGVGIHIWDTNGGDAQQFTIEPSNEPGFYYIRTKWGRAVDVAGYNPNSGASLNTYDLHAGDNQKWQFISVEEGYYKIKSKYGTYIDVQNGNPASGTPVWMYSGNGSAAQKWKLIPRRVEIPYATWSKSIIDIFMKTTVSSNNYTSIKNQYDNSGERAFFRPNNSYVYTIKKDGSQFRYPISLSVVESGLSKACKNYVSFLDSDPAVEKTKYSSCTNISINLPLKGEIIANCYNNVCCNNPFCNAACKNEVVNPRLQFSTIIEIINNKLSYRKIDLR